MIGTVVRLGWLNLKRDRVALVLTFVLPVVFFSVFASVFGAMDADEPRQIRAAIVNADSHPMSEALAERLRSRPEILDAAAPCRDREQALHRVQSGEVAVAVVLPPGLGDSYRSGTPMSVEVLADRSNPLASGLASGWIQSAMLELMRQETPAGSAAIVDPAPIVVVDAIGGAGRRPSVAFFAAGMGVMFLMFAVSGRSAILIEERETGVLRRMLAARATLGQFLAGRWMFLWLLGVAQVTVMFVWAAVAFGLDLWTPAHLSGFLVMTAATSAAAAAFGILLSSICRSRAQLNGVAAVTILVLSAIGGSLFPSFLMPEGLRSVGRLTFNAWALEGFQRVFWYDASVLDLWPQLLVLVASCALFLAAARLMARSWQHG